MADEHAIPHVNYFVIFLALCVLTAISVVADVVDIRSAAAVIVIVLAVATAKALFVMLYFMHLKFEGKWKFVLLAPTMILAIGLPMALLPDIGVQYYMVDTPQNNLADQPAHEEEPHGAQPEGGH